MEGEKDGRADAKAHGRVRNVAAMLDLGGRRAERRGGLPSAGRLSLVERWGGPGRWVARWL